jgi:hypothetical protein
MGLRIGAGFRLGRHALIGASISIDHGFPGQDRSEGDVAGQEGMTMPGKSAMIGRRERRPRGWGGGTGDRE